MQDHGREDHLHGIHELQLLTIIQGVQWTQQLQVQLQTLPMLPVRKKTDHTCKQVRLHLPPAEPLPQELSDVPASLEHAAEADQTPPPPTDEQSGRNTVLPSDVDAGSASARNTQMRIVSFASQQDVSTFSLHRGVSNEEESSISRKRKIEEYHMVDINSQNLAASWEMAKVYQSECYAQEREIYEKKENQRFKKINY